jgi:hypothetical protein
MRINRNVRAALCLTTLLVIPCGTPTNAFAQEARSEAAQVSQHALAGSWLVTYDVPAFGAPFPLLLSVATGGVVMETDAPGKFPLGPGFLTILTNGHGAWEPVRGRRGFTYLYRKLIYLEDGLTPFGITRTRASGSVGADGQAFTATIAIEIADLAGQVLFVAEGTASGAKIRLIEADAR